MRRYAQVACRQGNRPQAGNTHSSNEVDTAGFDFAIWVSCWAYSSVPSSCSIDEGDDTGSIDFEIFSLGAKDNPTTIEGTAGTRPNAAGGELRVVFIDTTLRKRYLKSDLRGNANARLASFMILGRKSEWNDADQTNAVPGFGSAIPGSGEYARIF